MAKSPVVMTGESLVGTERTMEKICGPVANYADTERGSHRASPHA